MRFVWRRADFTIQVQLAHAVFVEWGISGDHLGNQDTKRPYVGRRVVSSIENHFWRNVKWRSTESVRLVDNLFSCSNDLEKS